ncbi:MAG: hypothetical protein HY431_00540 [Candidatus Levybacteria bacterium]|nr:hypothetical protein [Candidatus Levybacteria bacterium]
MKKHFYSHVVEMETIKIELDAMDLSPEEKEHLLSLADSNIHHSVVDTILSELSHEDKKIFLRLAALDDHNAIWRHLNKKVNDIQVKIKKTASRILTELHQDIQEAKEKKR